MDKRSGWINKCTFTTGHRICGRTVTNIVDTLQFHVLWVSVFLWQLREPLPSTSSQSLHWSLDPTQWTTRGKKVLSFFYQGTWHKISVKYISMQKKKTQALFGIIMQSSVVYFSIPLQRKERDGWLIYFCSIPGRLPFPLWPTPTVWTCQLVFSSRWTAPCLSHCPLFRGWAMLLVRTFQVLNIYWKDRAHLFDNLGFNLS